MSFKNELQELCQKRSSAIPAYTDEREPTGPPHRRTFVRKVTVTLDGATLIEIGEGHSKKEADQQAAENMLKKIRGGQTNDQDMLEPDPYDKPVASPSRFKGRLQEALAKLALPPPEYEIVSARGPAHKRDFVIKCVVGGLEGEGRGSTKKDAESNAAKNLLSEIEPSLARGVLPSHVHCRRPSPPPLRDVYIEEPILSKFGPSYESRQGEAGVYLCLVRTTVGEQLAAQGMSMENADCAKDQAARNLVSSLRALGHVPS